MLVVGLVAAAGPFGVVHLATAGTTGSPSATAPGAVPSLPTTGAFSNLRLITTSTAFYNTTGSGQAASAGFTSLDNATTIRCASSRGCIVEATQDVQATSLTPGNNWATCARVDSESLTTLACPYQGEPTAGVYGAGSFSQWVQLAKGTHTLQTFAFVGSGAYLGEWTVKYTLYWR